MLSIIADHRGDVSPLSFLVLVTDQHPGHALGYAGHPVVTTPNIDSLAARSTVFDAATVANPSCMPNRASMLTGRYPSSHGTRTNGIPLEERPIDINVLLAASEVFLTGSVMEIMPVTAIERHPVGSREPGEITKQIQALYSERVAEECGRDG